MLSLFAVIAAMLMTPKADVLNVEQTRHLLAVSVVIRAKVYATDPQTKEIHRGLVGCSGTYISSSTVLTAAHCFSYPQTGIWVRGQDGTSYVAHLKKLDLKRDLALLSVENSENKRYARISQAVRVGEEVYNVGSPFQMEFLVSEGIVAQVGKRVKDFTGSFLVTTAMINSGSSGGGAFNEAGELIGVNTLTVGGLFGWAGITMSVDRHTVAEFLKEN